MGYVSTTGVGGCNRPDALHHGGGFVGRQPDGCTAGHEIAQGSVQLVEDPGAFVHDVVTLLGSAAAG